MDSITNNLYLSGFVAVKRISAWSHWVDVNIVDRTVNGVAKFFRRASEFARQFQPGLLRGYAFTMAIAFVLIAGYYLLGGK